MLGDKAQIGEAWRRFLLNPNDNPPGVRPAILESWRRSHRYGVDPQSMAKAVLTPTELAERLDQNRRLHDIASPILRDLHAFVTGSGFLSILCDGEGYILDILGDDDTMAAAARNLLVPGARRSEENIGTNGIGTCIGIGEPIQVWADEHYYKPHSVWTCSAAPVFSPDGGLAGVLCLSGGWDKVHYHTLGMVAAAAKAVSKQMALAESLARADDTRRKLDQAIELLNYGLVFADADGTISHMNSLAIPLLAPDKRNKGDLAGTNIADRLPLDTAEWAAALATPGGREYDLETRAGPLHVAIASTADDGGGTGAGAEMIVTLRKAEHVHKMVNRIVGSSAKFTWDDIAGRSDAIVEAKRLARIAAPYPSNVLLTGESGTGKELFAQAMHNASDRASAPFIAINCGALPRSLIESELFGHEGGSFTGSRRGGQAGKFELANGGTIFLDEIGDMPYEVQAHLLRVLQTREVVRIGGKRPVRVDVRIISATNRNLDDRMSAQSFREDLYYRLNVYAIHIPPLRERTGDIALLARHMLTRYAAAFGKRVSGIDDEALAALERHDWPGNVRELENTMERAVLLCKGESIGVADLPPAMFGGKSARMRAKPEAPTERLSPAQYEESLIREAMRRHKGNIRQIAIDLGLGRSTLYRKLAKYGIDVDADRG